MKSIKYFIEFLFESPKFMNKSFFHLLIHQKLIKRAIWYTKVMKETEKMINQK